MSSVSAIGPRRTAQRVSGMADADLVAQAREGAGWAHEALYRRHASLVFGLAHRLLGGREHEVDDVAQEAFLQAFEKLDKLRDAQSFAKWVGSIAVRCAQRRLRRERLRRRLGLGPAESIDTERLIAPTTPPDVAAELRRLYAAVGAMPVQVRTALILRRVEGMSVDEIAEHMSLSRSTVKRRVARGEAQLAKLIGGAP
ncbi:MAG: sigma-70 family RNA polymerase sigma factor [Myxococcales bacterium]|nr:sigma-70 family RNA polymerase sigma factor [Myxococcales bacterium]